MGELFKKGDTVRLKSGGPLMTVEKINKTEPYFTGKPSEFNGRVTCTWFEGTVRKSESFDQDTLMPDEDE